MNFYDLEKNFKQYALRERGMTAKSARSILQAMGKLMDSAGTENIKKLDAETVRHYLNSASDNRLWSPKTFRNQRQCISSYFAWAFRNGFVKKNPTDAIGKPKLPRQLPRFLTRQQVQRVLSAAEWISWRSDFERRRNRAIISTFLFTGIRHQELLNLTVADIDLCNASIFVRKGKGSKDRMLPIHPKLLPVLKDYSRSRESLAKTGGWYFQSSKSPAQLTQKNVQAICKKISVRSGIKFSPHMLRHTFGRLSVEGNLNLYSLKEMMGHSSISTTQRYLSVSGEKLREGIGQIEFV